MNKTIENRIASVVGGLSTASKYLSEDLECICDDTMRDYAKSTFNAVQKASFHASFLIDHISLYLDALADIAMYVGYRNIEFKDSNQRNITLRQWTQEFVDKYADADWQKMDYNILVGEFAVEKVSNLKF